MQRLLALEKVPVHRILAELHDVPLKLLHVVAPRVLAPTPAFARRALLLPLTKFEKKNTHTHKKVEVTDSHMHSLEIHSALSVKKMLNPPSPWFS